MKFGGSIAVLTFVFGGFVQSASARDMNDGLSPAEIPPASYTASTYVDSTGCVYIRTRGGGASAWVPQVTRDRKLVCGMKPSLGASATTARRPVETAPVAPAPVAVKPVASKPVAAVAPRTPSKPKMSVSSSPARNGHRFVQIGGYAEPANVARARARLTQMGYGVSSSVSVHGGRRITTVLAGPFASPSELSSALRALRAAGYSDAFTRR